MPYVHYDPDYKYFIWQEGLHGPGELLGTLWRRLSIVVSFVLGLPLLLAVLAVGRAFRRQGLLVATVGLVVVSSGLTGWWFPHYSAPLALPLVALAMIGLERLTPITLRGRVVTWQVVLALVVIQLAGFALQVPAHRPDAGDWSRARQGLERRLAKLPGRDLVFVAGGFPLHETWVANRAAPREAEVVWAHDLGPGRNRETAAAYPDRRAWRLSPGELPGAPLLAPAGAGDPR